MTFLDNVNKFNLRENERGRNDKRIKVYGNSEHQVYVSRELVAEFSLDVEDKEKIRSITNPFRKLANTVITVNKNNLKHKSKPSHDFSLPTSRHETKMVRSSLPSFALKYAEIVDNLRETRTIEDKNQRLEEIMEAQNPAVVERVVKGDITNQLQTLAQVLEKLEHQHGVLGAAGPVADKTEDEVAHKAEEDPSTPHDLLGALSPSLTTRKPSMFRLSSFPARLMQIGESKSRALEAEKAGYLGEGEASPRLQGAGNSKLSRLLSGNFTKSHQPDDIYLPPIVEKKKRRSTLAAVDQIHKDTRSSTYSSMPAGVLPKINAVNSLIRDSVWEAVETKDSKEEREARERAEAEEQRKAEASRQHAKDRWSSLQGWVLRKGWRKQTLRADIRPDVLEPLQEGWAGMEGPGSWISRGMASLRIERQAILHSSCRSIFRRGSAQQMYVESESLACKRIYHSHSVETALQDLWRSLGYPPDSHIPLSDFLEIYAVWAQELRPRRQRTLRELHLEGLDEFAVLTRRNTQELDFQAFTLAMFILAENFASKITESRYLTWIRTLSNRTHILLSARLPRLKRLAQDSPATIDTVNTLRPPPSLLEQLGRLTNEIEMEKVEIVNSHAEPEEVAKVEEEVDVVNPLLRGFSGIQGIYSRTRGRRRRTGILDDDSDLDEYMKSKTFKLPRDTTPNNPLTHRIKEKKKKNQQKKD